MNETAQNPRIQERLFISRLLIQTKKVRNYQQRKPIYMLQVVNVNTNTHEIHTKQVLESKNESITTNPYHLHYIIASITKFTILVLSTRE